ncbi:MAG: radical SAM protein [Patescibacteria group bacterium]
MRFLIINPPYVIGEDGMAVMPNKAMLPVGPLSIASAIEAKGHKVKFADLVFQKDWRGHLVQFGTSFDRVLMCCHTARNISSVKTVLDFLREQDVRSHVSLGGNLTLGLGINDFAKFGIEVDAVVRGFGHGGAIDAIVEGGKGDVKVKGVIPEIPTPHLSLLDKRTRALYRDHSEGRYPIIGSGGFGCRWFQKCNYCTSHMGTTSTPRDFDNLLQETATAMGFGYRDFWCVDNLVNVFPEQLLKFDTALYLRGCTWSGMTRPELVVKYPSLITKLRSCSEIAMGVESASQEQVTSYNRGNGKYYDHIKEAFQLVKNSGINTTAFAILDGPKETEESFWRLYHFLKNVKPTSVSWSFYNPPATIGLLDEGRLPNEYGFYRWPMGCSIIPRERIIQQAMILSGTWWCGWKLDEGNPFFENEHEFGVKFHGKLLSQPRSARSPIGDLWEIWEEQNL